MITINGVTLDIDGDLIKRYQRLTGDTDEILPLSCAVLLEAQTGLSTDDALRKLSKEQLEFFVVEGMLSELSAFGGQ